MRNPESTTSGLSLRVLLMTDNFGGGTGNHLKWLVDEWRELNCRASIISQVSPTLADLPKVPVASPGHGGHFDRFPLAQLRRLRFALRYISSFLPDIVHTYFFWSIVYGRLLKKAGKIRYLIENREDMGFNWGPEAYWLLRHTRTLPDRVICVCEAVRNHVLEKEGLDVTRVEVIHNGIPPIGNHARETGRERDRLGFGEQDQIVGIVANLNRPVKGVSYFIESIPHVISKVPSARFLIVGGGRLERELREKARALGIEPFVRFVGFQHEVERYYAMMNVSALTSHSEGLSLTLLESMAHGLPVVVTRVGGNPEVVVDGESGYLVPPGDVGAFVHRVVELLRDPDLRTRMGEAGRRRVRERFRVSAVALAYLEAYRKVLQLEC